MHSPAFGNSIALANVSAKIHWAFLFINRKCLDLCPGKGRYYKHNVNLPLCLCSSQKLAAHPGTVTAMAQDAEVAETTKGKSNIAHCWPPAAGVAHPFGGPCTAHDIPHSAGPLWSENWYLPPDVSPAARQVYEVMEPGCLQSALLYYIQSKLASQKMLH